MKCSNKHGACGCGLTFTRNNDRQLWKRNQVENHLHGSRLQHILIRQSFIRRHPVWHRHEYLWFHKSWSSSSSLCTCPGADIEIAMNTKTISIQGGDRSNVGSLPKWELQNWVNVFESGDRWYNNHSSSASLRMSATPSTLFDFYSSTSPSLSLSLSLSSLRKRGSFDALIVIGG